MHIAGLRSICRGKLTPCDSCLRWLGELFLIMTWIFHAPLKPNHNTDNKSPLFTARSGLILKHFPGAWLQKKNGGGKTYEKLILGWSLKTNITLTSIKLDGYYNVTGQGALLLL